MSLDQRSDYRQVAVFSRLDEAEVARGMLEADGIPAALLDAQVAALGLGPAVGGVRLLVPAWDEARAVELLTQPAWSPDGAAPTPTPWGLTSPTPPPAPAGAPTPAPLPRGARPGEGAALAPDLAAGPLALRVAVLVALALAVAVIAALR